MFKMEIQTVKKLINSNIDATTIERNTGVDASSIRRIRREERTVEKLSFEKGIALLHYQKELTKMTELNDKIVEVENPNNIVEFENLQQFFSDIEEMSNGTFKVDFETLEKVEHDNGSIYYMVTTNSTEEIEFNDKVDDENIEILYDRWLEKDQGEETHIESIFFENEQDAKDYIKVVLKGYDTFKECAKAIGVIE
ncbi:hypothetical protein [Staphylococcus epidermidis]|uniref:hypothetical protein n=2 Tax=Staphylococcus epidermidis TaxID=1282 RepID=UPI0029034978|nr:hypothetical protein [Staphylococcus epidermidis]MDU0432290.1 hypothetical protein [Staphylococcus epidermidis]MDU0471480.1 hypothetical protein [Staphylococcus epidermidis]